MNFPKIIAKFLLICIIFAATLSGATQPKPKELPTATAKEVGMSQEKLDEIAPAVRKFIDDEQITGASVLVARNGKIIYNETFGLMDREAKKETQKDTIYRFYSMTKPITSVAAMILYDQGKIKLDDPVSNYLPEFKDLKVYDESGKNVELNKPMTVRDLLRHTSGLTYGIFGNTPVDKMYRQQKILNRNIPLEKMTDSLGKIPLQYQPGTKWHYSVSADVLGALIERVSGESLDEFFQENIFKPLDMKDTSFMVPKDKVQRFAACYSPKPGKGLKLNDAPKTSEYLTKPVKLSGGGGLVSTGRDYMRFCQMLANEGQLNGTRILKKETVNMMTQNQLPKGVYQGIGSGFGLGFSVRLFGGKIPKGEYGWGGAASTHFWISPKDKIVVIALSQHMPFSFRLESAIKPIVYDAIIK
ncbi:MAG: beta-lactamase family protein [Phycisphaerae bacterium]|nr:beta-lactamase family protein [Phycisphaerae bacterium]